MTEKQMELSDIINRLDGMDKRLAHIEEALSGDLHSLGVVAKVNILWRSWVWLLCAASALVGGFSVWVVERLV